MENFLNAFLRVGMLLALKEREMNVKNEMKKYNCAMEASCSCYHQQIQVLCRRRSSYIDTHLLEIFHFGSLFFVSGIKLLEIVKLANYAQWHFENVVC